MRTITPPKTNGWIPKMMVWERWLLLNMAIFGIYMLNFWGVIYNSEEGIKICQII